jgi:hypothetical protein
LEHIIDHISDSLHGISSSRLELKFNGVEQRFSELSGIDLFICENKECSKQVSSQK